MTLMLEEKTNPRKTLGRHILTLEDRQKAHSPEALEKRRQTLAERRENRVLDVVDCKRWGMVDAAIADYLELSDSYVRQLLSEAKRRGLLLGEGDVTA